MNAFTGIFQGFYLFLRNKYFYTFYKNKLSKGLLPNFVANVNSVNNINSFSKTI